MKFLHLADLHFGKSIFGTSLIENGDQGFWVERFLELTDDEKPDAVVIAGDVYDRSAPSGEAVKLMSRFLTGLVNRGIQVMLIAGNHDSAERLSFARELLSKQKLHISGDLTDSCELTHVTLQDEYGPVTFWLMPYVFPALLSKALDDDSIKEYDSGIRRLLAKQNINFSERNVLIAHQNVTAFGKEAERGGSETMIGGVGQVDFTAFNGFDYVALGHIHRAYAVGRESVRYAGSPMCYHFDETKQNEKGPLLIELGKKEMEPQIELKPITPLHPMRELKGTYPEIKGCLESGQVENSYLRVVITDCRISPEISDYLQALCASKGCILMERVSEYREFKQIQKNLDSEDIKKRSVEELFSDFFRERSGDDLDETTKSFLKFIAEQSMNKDTLLEEASEEEIENAANYLMGVKL